MSIHIFFAHLLPHHGLIPDTSLTERKSCHHNGGKEWSTCPHAAVALSQRQCQTIKQILTQYIAELPAGQVKLLACDSNTHKKWKKIRQRAGLPDLRFQDLRVAFSSILQAQGVGLDVVQNLLKHNSPVLTERYYIHVDALLRPGVERLPVEDWLV